MPTYTFEDTKTGKVWDEMISISERELFLKDNPHIKQKPAAAAIIAGVGGIRTDSGWKENISRIAEAHPTSALASQHGDKSAKSVKTRKAVEKWRTKRAADPRK